MGGVQFKKWRHKKGLQNNIYCQLSLKKSVNGVTCVFVVNFRS